MFVCVYGETRGRKGVEKWWWRVEDESKEEDCLSFELTKFDRHQRKGRLLEVVGGGLDWQNPPQMLRLNKKRRDGVKTKG